MGENFLSVKTYQILKSPWDSSVILEKSLLLLTYNSRVFGSVNTSRNSEGFFSLIMFYQEPGKEIK